MRIRGSAPNNTPSPRYRRQKQPQQHQHQHQQHHYHAQHHQYMDNDDRLLLSSSKHRKHHRQPMTAKQFTSRFLLLCFLLVIFVLSPFVVWEKTSRSTEEQRRQKELRDHHPTTNNYSISTPDTSFPIKESKPNIISVPSSSNNNKPFFILHIGPPKTGSTTLQCTLESLRFQLEQDDIAYIGRPECTNVNIDAKHKREFNKFASALVTDYNCQRQMNEFEEEKRQLNDNKNDDEVEYPACWTNFLSHLNTTYFSSQTSIIFSDEAMSNRLTLSKGYRPNLPYPFTTLKTSLEHMGWNVVVLMVHRPLYDYLPSVYVEQFKEGPYKRKLNLWFGDGKKEEEDGKGSVCPQEKGRVVPRPFEMNTEEITIARLFAQTQQQQQQKEMQQLYPTPVQVHGVSTKYNFTTILVDMMDRFSLNGRKNFNFIQHIICNTIPGTTYTCAALLNNQTGITKENPSTSLYYDLIAVEACQAGFFNGTLISRNVAKRAIQYHQEVDLNAFPTDFPLVCPTNETLQSILNMSIHHERRLDSNTWNVDKEVWYRQQFWKNRIKYCTVDSKQVVQEEDWRLFLSRIQPE